MYVLLFCSKVILTYVKTVKYVENMKSDTSTWNTIYKVEWLTYYDSNKPNFSYAYVGNEISPFPNTSTVTSKIYASVLNLLYRSDCKLHLTCRGFNKVHCIMKKSVVDGIWRKSDGFMKPWLLSWNKNVLQLPVDALFQCL